jgi:hypothetical protein
MMAVLAGYLPAEIFKRYPTFIYSKGSRVQGSGFRVQGSRFTVQGSMLWVQGSGLRVLGSGFNATAGSERPVKSKKKH